MNDILPDTSHIWRAVEDACVQVLLQRGYHQIRTPIVESTNLFARSIGADTDIVSKEMYTFEDRNGDSLTLRPEGTASCVRAGIEHGLFYNQQQRLFYIGPMFRHERPQKGRYRQFHQLGAECYGWPGADIEAEVIASNHAMFQYLGLRDTQLQINSLGDSQARAEYRRSLLSYLEGHVDALDEDSVRRMQSNPLRILDSKNAQVQQVLQNAPSILDFLSEDSAAHFQQLQGFLSDLDIEYTVNPRLVRGLDYYNDTVFEWVNADFGAQATVCAGGRYDGMVQQLGGTPTPCFGFAMGIERLVQILSEQEAAISQQSNQPDVFIISTDLESRSQALRLQRELCDSQNAQKRLEAEQGHAFSVQLFCGEGSLKNQFKRADKSGAKLAIVIGEQERLDNTATVKLLRGNFGEEQQRTIAQKDVLNVVTNLLESL